MKSRYKVLVLLALALVSATLWAVASDSGWSSGMAPTRFMGIKVDRASGTPVNGIYIGTATLAGDTTKDVTLTGMSASAKVFTSKATGTTASYVKTTTVVAGVVSLTMSAATTGTVQVIAFDVFTDPLTF